MDKNYNCFKNNNNKLIFLINIYNNQFYINDKESQINIKNNKDNTNNFILSKDNTININLKEYDINNISNKSLNKIYKENFNDNQEKEISKTIRNYNRNKDNENF